MNKGFPWRLRWGDLLVLSCVVVAGVVGLRGRQRGGGGGVVVVSGWRNTTRLPLGTEGVHRLEVEGPLGVTVVEVGKGLARIVSSPCPEKVCQKMGAVGVAGDWVACVPNRVVVKVEARDQLDGVTR